MSRKDSVEMKAADGHWMLSANPDLHEWERRAYIHTDQRVFLPGGPSEQRLFFKALEENQSLVMAEGHPYFDADWLIDQLNSDLACEYIGIYRARSPKNTRRMKSEGDDVTGDPVWLIAPDASIKCEHWERLVCVDGDVIYAPGGECEAELFMDAKQAGVVIVYSDGHFYFPVPWLKELMSDDVDLLMRFAGGVCWRTSEAAASGPRRERARPPAQLSNTWESADINH